MQYTVNLNGRNYMLPKRTMAITERMDETANVDSLKNYSVREKFKKVHDCVVGIVGEENAREIFGTDNIDDMDVSEITLAFRKIVDAYNKPLTDYEMQQSREKFSALPIDKIAEIRKAADAVSSLPQKS